MPELESERLRLRQFQEADLDELAAMSADPEVMRFVGGKPLERLDSWRLLCAILGHWQLRGYGMWAVEEKATGRLVGRLGFINHDGWPGFELGWTLARSSWGKGYATEGARTALEYGFTELDKDHVISLIHPENVRSIGVAERIGESYERTIDFLDQEIHVYGIDREAWSRSR